MAEVPKQLAIARELENAILRRGSSNPDVALPVNHDGLQRRGPDSQISWASPAVQNVAFRIQFDGFRSSDATVNARWLAVSADLIPIGRRAAIQEPDMAGFVFDIQASYLLHAPTIGQRFRPEGIYFEQRCSCRVPRLI